MRLSLLFFLFSFALLAQPDVSGITQPAGGNPTLIVANESGTGTTLNTLTKLTGAPSTAIIATAGDTGGVIGVCTAGCGTTGSATITLMGRVSLAFDGATTANHYVQISAGTNGDGTDGGSTYPISGQVNGRVLSTNGGAGTYDIDLFPSEIKASSGGGGPGSTLFTYVNATGTGPNNSNAETSLIGTATTGSKTIPANTMVAGQLLQAVVTGQITTPVSPDNLTLNMYMGATKVGTGTITGTNLDSLTTQSFTLKVTFFILTGGASCAVLVEDLSVLSGALVAGDITKFQGTGTTFDCTATQTFDVKAQWANAQSGESLLGMGVGLYIPGAPVYSVNGKTGAVTVGTLSPNGYYLNDGTNNYLGVTNQIATLPTAGTYTWVNQGTATETAAGNALTLHALPSSGANVRIREAAISTNSTLTLALICNLVGGSTNATCAAGWRESGTGKLEFLALQASGGNAALYIFQYNSPTSFSAVALNSGNIPSPFSTGLLWIRLVITGGNISISYSNDGVNFPVGYSEAQNAFFTTAPDQWWYGADPEGATQDVYVTLLSWLASP